MDLKGILYDDMSYNCDFTREFHEFVSTFDTITLAADGNYCYDNPGFERKDVKQKI